MSRLQNEAESGSAAASGRRQETRTKALTPDELARARLNPAAVFDSPRDVDDDLSIELETKIDILLRWEYDVREQVVALEEKMPREPLISLVEGHTALHALGVEPATNKAPTTKQGAI